jgi:hypothetical protein
MVDSYAVSVVVERLVKKDVLEHIYVREGIIALKSA